MSKSLITLLLLVCIGTVSCKKGPTEPTITQYAIEIHIQGSEPIKFFGTISKSGNSQDIDGTTPKEWSAGLTVPGEILSITATKDQQTGKLSIILIDHTNGATLVYGETSADSGSVQVSFP